MANDKVVTVNRGATYEAKKEDTQGEKRRVAPFLVDRPRGNVRFAELGSGREESLSIDEFLDNFELIAQQGEPLPENAKENSKAQAQAEKEKEAARAEPSRAPKLDTTKASPTREDLEARAEARQK